MSRTTIRSIVLLTGALLAVAVDVADGVEDPGLRLLEGAVLSAVFLGLIRLLGERELLAPLTDPAPRGAQDVVWAVFVLAAGPVLALLSDGFGLRIAVLEVALAAFVLLEARSERPQRV